MILREVKSTVKDLAVTKLSTIVGEPLNDILSTTSHKVQCGTQPVAHNVVELFMLGQLRKGIITEMLEAHVAKSFDTDTAAEVS